ncbi:hypothetical protein HJG60_010649 [Phyllostomus discolor]|uniref:Uncharacterized protein n=1 Tax=Phyllostomus discolor TaxID=89673 RepID=A0A834EBG4_9CHIR|nr:hypothetical protein HJG60_010649 [Phyllostomus discolor]
MLMAKEAKFLPLSVQSLLVIKKKKKKKKLEGIGGDRLGVWEKGRLCRRCGSRRLVDEELESPRNSRGKSRILKSADAIGEMQVGAAADLGESQDPRGISWRQRSQRLAEESVCRPPLAQVEDRKLSSAFKPGEPTLF